MSVKIRLSRAGKKHEPYHRIVVMDSRQKRNGAEIANIGTIDAVKGLVVRFDLALYDAWIQKGAQPTDSAKKLYKLAKRSQATVSSVDSLSPRKSAKIKAEQEVTEVSESSQE